MRPLLPDRWTIMEMRSERLQEAFESDYQQFFVQHDLVVSVPHVFRWWHSIARGKNIISIKQKLPARMFAGIVRKREPGVSIKQITVFHQKSQTRQTTAMSQVVAEIDKREQFLERVLKQLGCVGGVEVNLMTEYPRGNGLGFVGTMSSLLAIVALLVTDHMKPADIDDYEQFCGTSLFRCAVFIWLMMNAVCTGKKPGLQWYVALAYGAEPMMRLNKIDLEAERKRLQRSDHFFEDFLAIEDTIQTKLNDQFLSFKDFAKLPPQANTTPFDYSILYLGLPHETTRIYRSYMWFQELYEQVLDYITTTKQELGISKEKKESLLDLDEISYFFAAHLLQRREQLANHPYDNSLREWFLQAINDNGTYHSLIERENRMLIELPALFNRLKGIDSEVIGIMPISTAKAGGCYLCVTPYQQSHKTMQQLLVELQEGDYPDACFHYLSWRDGEDPNGALVHQYLSEEVYSHYVKSGNVAVMFADGKTKILHHTDLGAVDYEGVMLDTIARKVFVNKQKVTHRDLVSQSGTVELFDYLLDRLGEYVSHNDLPPSSYTRNKNEMIGKIIAPFTTLIKEQFDVELPVVCTGTTYDFQLCLKDDANLLHVVKKLGGRE